ncbi:hypothetical protein LL038_02465 [Clostridium estertheticum]|uniref:Uncharacterized protein n=1 Tax=Clostridium estertheticum TaxID=238834 RepID=A0AA47ELC1_9CLOT|nr:hypothetical protein [Clostridium estertheticum]MBU3155075.1 hypothetical protein [Clostridium estertheticum]WAG61131.1 hypothetical protein LL038_02465 [Clostridium estertheticum]
MAIGLAAGAYFIIVDGYFYYVEKRVKSSYCLAILLKFKIFNSSVF